MTTAVRVSREERFKWLIAPFIWASNACLLAMLAGVSLATDASISPTYAVIALMAALAVVLGLVVFGIIRMRAAYEG